MRVEEERMKESGKEKLIELLNEYEDGMVSWVKEYVEEFGVFVLNTEQMIEEEIIISKSFGFIQWLVQNGNIDFSNLKISELTSGTDLFYSFSETEVLLMLLSISDTPISDLVSYLK